jgi:hypothetical protein
MKRVMIAGIFSLAILGVMAQSSRREAGYRREGHPQQTAALAEQRRVSDPVPQPADWVAFQATMTKTVPDKPTVVGRFYRSASGSERLETGPTLSDVRIVAIKDVPNSVYYRYGARQGWTSAPMQLPRTGWRPIQVQKTMKGLSLYPYKLALMEGQDGSLTATEGLQAYLYVNDAGDQFLEAPELNFFHIVRMQASTGKREAYSQVRLGEPPAELFTPPSGVSITKLQTPDGIVDHRR